MREIITVACIGCESPGKSVYSTMKNKKNDPDRAEEVLFLLPQARGA